METVPDSLHGFLYNYKMPCNSLPGGISGTLVGPDPGVWISIESFQSLNPPGSQKCLKGCFLAILILSGLLLRRREIPGIYTLLQKNCIFH